MFAKKAVLKKAARGLAKINTLFAVIPKNQTSEAVAAAAAVAAATAAAAAVAAATAAPAAATAADTGEDGDESDDEDLVHKTTVGTCCTQKLMSL